jgi:Lon protease-like protein
MIEPTELGLFPLSVVLLPGEVAPLHIFEERYKLLFNELMDGGEFGTILVEEEGLRERGCSARLAQLIERMDDGRLNVLVQGARRFRLLEIREPEDLGSTYLTGVVEFFDDDEPEAPQELVAKALEAFRRMLVLMDVPSPREPAGEGPLSFRLGAAVDFGAPLKQELLEAVSEQQRLETLLAIIETLLPRLELRRQREGAIRGNGKGH